MSGTAVDQCEGRRAAHAQGAISALLRRREISLRAVISRAARAMPNVARRMGSRVLRGLSILAALVILIPAVTAPTAARAQAQAPYNGWCTVIAAGELQCFGEPLQACQLQWEIYSGGSPFEGFSNVYNSSGALDQIAKQCLWTAPPGSGPAPILLYCNNQFAPCPAPPPCTCDNAGGDPAASTPHPIDVLSGNKQFVVQDFSNQSRTLALNRVSNSLANGGPGLQPNPNPLGLANWAFDFQLELLIYNCCSPTPNISVLTPNGASPGFQSNGSSTLLPTGTFATPQTNYALSIVGAWPANLTAAPTTWTLTDSSDTTYTLQTFRDPVSGAYWIARPISMTRRNGVTWTFTYGSKYQISSITDYFGNRISFSWLYNSSNGAPAAISAANLPGGCQVKYNYSTIAAGTGISQPDILTNVQYLDNHSVVQDQTTYAYASAANPLSVTGVFDANGVQRWGVSYDPNTGQALTSSSNGSASAAVATGSISGTTMTATAMLSGTLAVGQNVTGAGIALGTVITALGTGTGGTRTYTITPSQTVTSGTLTELPPSAAITGSIAPNSAVFNASISGPFLTVNSLASGALGAGQVVTGAGVTGGTVIVSGGGTGWMVNNSQTVSSEAMTSLPAVATVTGSIGPSSTTMTVTAVAAGTLAVGQVVNGAGVTSGTTITAFGTGRGGPGNYTVGVSQTAASTTMTATGGSLTVTGVTSGVLAVGQSVKGTGVAAGTVISTLGAGTTGVGVETVSVPQTVGSTALTTLPNAAPNAAVATGSIAPNFAVVTGSIGPSSTTMTVSAVTSGTLGIGQTVTGIGVASGTKITAFGSAHSGGTGTYTVSISQTVAATTLTAADTQLTVTGVTAGQLGVGQSVTGSGVAAGTIIAALGTGLGGAGTYTVNTSQTVGSTSLWMAANAAVVTGAIAPNTAVVTGSIAPSAAVVTGAISPNQAVVTGSISTTAAVVTGSIAPNAAVVTGSISPNAAVVTGSISSTTMTVTAVTSGALAVGQPITGTGVAGGTVITALGTGTGGTGTYTVNYGQTVGSGTTLTSPVPTMTITAVTSGTVAVGQIVTGAGVSVGTAVTALGTGTGGTGTYTVNLSQTVASRTLGGGSPTMTVTAVTSGALAVGQGVTGTGVSTGTVISALGTGAGGTGTYGVSIAQTVASRTLTGVAPTMTVTAVTSGILAVGQSVTGTGVSAGTAITALVSGTGGTGTYTVSVPQTVSSTTLTAPGPTMTVTAVTSGILSVGQAVTGTGVAAGTVVSGFGTGAGGTGSYLVNVSQTVASRTLTATGSVGTMSVTAVTSGVLAAGQAVTGTGVAAGTNIIALGTGTGGTGTYTVNMAQTVASGTLTGTGTGGLLTVTAMTAGALAVGQAVTGPGVAAGTAITAPGTGTGGTGGYILNNSQTVASTVLTAVSISDQAYQVAYAPLPASGASFIRTVTNPLGKVSVYSYLYSGGQGLQLTSVANLASPLSPASSKSYTFGSDAFTAQVTDENGNVETQTHDPRGMPAQVVEASTSTAPRTTTTTWDPTWHEPHTVAAATVTTGFTYNGQGAPLTRTLTDNTTFTVPYATNGRTKTWNFGWNAAGQLLAVHGPRWVTGGTVDTTTFTYNAGGYVQTIANPLGQTTTVTAWDWRGAPLSMTDPNGVATTFSYDIRGRLLTATINPGGAASQYQFAYDAVGDLARVTLPAGASLTYTVDQDRRVAQLRNVRGETQTFAYDGKDDPLSLVTRNGAGSTTYSHASAYDEWGRLLQSIVNGAYIWNLAYDKLSNLTSVTDPLSHQRQNAWDPLNRVATRTDPQLNTIGYAYDTANNLDQLTDSRSLVTTREVDGFGEIIQEISPDRGTRSYWYDLSSNLTKLIDGDSEETDVTYDAANRRTGKTFPGDAYETVTYGYDATAGGNRGIGRLTGVTEASGSTNLTYDAQGRVVADAKVIDLGGYFTPLTVGYAYDANGKVIQITYPSGDVVKVARTTDGLITAVTETPSGAAQENIATAVAWEPFGPLASLTYGNGLNLTRSYTLGDYRLGEIKVAPTSGASVLDLTFGYKNDLRLGGVTDNAGTGRSATYGYTSSGRVNATTGPWGSLAYSYDAAGNRTQTGTATAYVTSTLSTTSNQVASTANQSGVTQRTLTYRDGGDESLDQHAGGTLFEYDYNAVKRLVEVQQNSVEAGAYAYDFLGQRVWRQTFGTGAFQTSYVYDRGGHLIAEHNATTGAVIREYVWIDDMPVALLNISGTTVTTDFIHTGQIDEPLTVTSSTQAVVWNATVDPFGTATITGTPATPLDMRLPGQSFQMETDSLSQNHWRDYDPILARYLQADRLGIDAGQNVYAYVDGDPLNRRDSWGLWSVSVSGYVGVGSSLTFGDDSSPGGGFFVTGQAGVGLGGGVSFDPNGVAPGNYPLGPCPPVQRNGSAGLFAQGDFSLFGIEADSSVTYLTSFFNNTYSGPTAQYNSPDSPNYTLPSPSADASVSAGGEITVFPFNSPSPACGCD